MRPIPTKMRQEIEESGINKTCALADDTCSGGIQWHHAFIYAGRQINEPWAIIGVCNGHHDKVNGSRTIKEKLQYIGLQRATDEDLKKYPKASWQWLKKYLNIYAPKEDKKLSTF